MAVCPWCDQEMTDGVSCTVEAFHLDGRRIERVRNVGRWSTARCGDCGTPRRGAHHPGCDQERCALCGRQAISCGHRFDEDGPDEDAWLDDDELADPIDLGRLRADLDELGSQDPTPRG